MVTKGRRAGSIITYAAVVCWRRIRRIHAWTDQPVLHHSGEASVDRLLKARDLIASPAFIVKKATDEFTDKTTAPNCSTGTAA